MLPHYGLTTGTTYQARKGARSPYRTIIWISGEGDRVQYDGPAVAQGRHYPTITVDAFVKWAGIEQQYDQHRINNHEE